MQNPDFIYFEELESTNTYAMKNLSNLKDKDIIIASKQTNGRGQFDRKWSSDKQDNVYMSVVLKPEIKLNELPIANFSQYMSVVICKVLKSYGIIAEIKWPNDVLVENKKIAGILCESSTQGQRLNGLVIGVGINLNLDQNDIEKIDQPAISLNLLLKKYINKNIFIQKLIFEFFQNYESFLKYGIQLRR